MIDVRLLSARSQHVVLWDMQMNSTWLLFVSLCLAPPHLQEGADMLITDTCKHFEGLTAMESDPCLRRAFCSPYSPATNYSPD